MKKSIRIIACAVLCAGMILLAGCQLFDDEAVRMLTTATIDAILEDDAEQAYTYMASTVERETFDTAYTTIETLIGDTTAYTLKARSMDMTETNDETFTQVSYHMITDNAVYAVEAAIDSRYDGLARLAVTPAGGPELAATAVGEHPLQLVFVGIAVLETVFILWMAVDCARYKVKNKVLWMAAILFGMITITYTVSGDTTMTQSGFGFILSFTSLRLYGTQYCSARVLLPVGAVLYACLRKRLRLPEESQEEEMPTLTLMPESMRSSDE